MPTPQIGGALCFAVRGRLGNQLRSVLDGAERRALCCTGWALVFDTRYVEFPDARVTLLVRVEKG